jgi:hypothetical protein
VEDGGHIGEEGGALGAIGEPMVERGRQRGHPAWFNPLLGSRSDYPGPACDLTDAENARLPGVQDGSPGSNAEHPDVRDRERAAGHVGGLSLAVPRLSDPAFLILGTISPR